MNGPAFVLNRCDEFQAYSRFHRTVLWKFGRSIPFGNARFKVCPTSRYDPVWSDPGSSVLKKANLDWGCSLVFKIKRHNLSGSYDRMFFFLKMWHWCFSFSWSAFARTRVQSTENQSNRTQPCKMQFCVPGLRFTTPRVHGHTSLILLCWRYRRLFPYERSRIKPMFATDILESLSWFCSEKHPKPISCRTKIISCFPAKGLWHPHQYRVAVCTENHIRTSFSPSCGL